MRDRSVFFATTLLLGSIVIGCEKNEQKEQKASSALPESTQSHARDYVEGIGEEDSAQIGIDEKYDEVKNGVRLIAVFDKDNSRFVGSVENTTDKELKKVRVEIHLSNGKELGPTTPTNLRPGERREIKLNATGEQFATWNTHAEVGSGDHSNRSRESQGDREKGEHRTKDPEHLKAGEKKDDPAKTY